MYTIANFDAETWQPIIPIPKLHSVKEFVRMPSPGALQLVPFPNTQNNGLSVCPSINAHIPP